MSSIIYNGHEIQDLIVNGNQAQLWLNGQKLYPSAEPVDPYNPLGLPPFTIRCKFKSGVTPAPYATSGFTDSWDSQTLVDGTENIWDIVRNSTNWGTKRSGIGPGAGGRYGILYAQPDLVSVLGANTTGVTSFKSSFTNCSSLESIALFDTSSCSNMDAMFAGCESLTVVPLFDTSSCTNMSNMFKDCESLTVVPLFDTSSCEEMAYMFDDCSSLTSVPLFDTSSCSFMNEMFSGCTSLTSVPLFDTSSCTNMSNMFKDCTNVQSGALALYQQASTQTTPPTYHYNTFTDCGSNTVTGAAELAQIPTNWGGTMSDAPVDMPIEEE